MHAFTGFRFAGAQINEYDEPGLLDSSEPPRAPRMWDIGRVIDGQVLADGSVAITWQGKKTGDRDTVFSPASWRADDASGRLRLIRTGPDIGHCDLPRSETGLYVLWNNTPL